MGRLLGSETGARAGLRELPEAALPEMVDNARRIVQAVDIPVIADADTGYGNTINVIRTVHEYEAAGVSAIHLEDQVMPEKCEHMEGKQVVAATGAIRSALERIKADGTPIELLPSLPAFGEFLDFIGMDEIRDLEQRFADG
jgi:2-methylisocitrate lyase-like PEP mutase family enzyme